VKAKFVLPLLLASACSACSGSSDAGGDSAEPVALVSVAKVTAGSLSSTTTLYGAVEQGADAKFTLAAPAEAVVASIAAPAGTAVGRGQLVVSLRPSPATRADLAKARADAAAASEAHARARRLRADGLASDGDVETARAAAQGASAQLASVSSSTAALSLRAPGAGFVENVAVNPGDLVSSGATVATITRSGDLRARLGVSPALLRRLKAMRSVSVDIPGGQEISVPILSLDPAIDPQTRLAAIWIRVPSETGLGPGEPLTARVPVAQQGSTPTVPYSALLDDGGQPYVFVVKGSVAHRRDVRTGASAGKTASVTNGLKPGEMVVTAGGTALEDGMKVRTK
jgi:RND family efflux transporter MFP subunit